MENRALLITIGFAGAVTLILLLVDAVTGVLQARSVRDEDDLEFLSRTRVRELVWSIAITAVLAVLVAFAVDSVIRSAVNVHGDLRAVLLLLTAVWLGTFVVGLIGAVAAVRRERPSYARIRRDLRDRTVLAMSPEEHAAFTARLDRADRSRGRRWHASSLVRVLGLLVVLGSAAAAVAATGGRDASVLVLAVTGSGLGLVAFLVGVRAAEVRAAAIERVLEAQRAEVVVLLERARIPRSTSTPGLARRVSKALAILREQQN
ncbi:MAG: hypothetical protein HY996_06670 [Micrococcales bacterium]|nr:hypothetical protein [Micrococcales bacterium]